VEAPSDRSDLDTGLDIRHHRADHRAGVDRERALPVEQRQFIRALLAEIARPWDLRPRPLRTRIPPRRGTDRARRLRRTLVAGVGR
jgi:hypothetical protein